MPKKVLRRPKGPKEEDLLGPSTYQALKSLAPLDSDRIDRTLSKYARGGWRWEPPTSSQARSGGKPFVPLMKYELKASLHVLELVHPDHTKPPHVLEVIMVQVPGRGLLRRGRELGEVQMEILRKAA